MSTDIQNNKSRIAILDPLRGLAALSVMWFHFTNGGHLLDAGGTVNEWLKLSGKYGWAGVEFFFVISGFVLPYALFAGNYRLQHFGTFLVKRLIRLEPPYIASLLLIIALLFLGQFVPGYQGEKFTMDWARFFLHFGYLNSYFGYESYNPVYWTLAIELQFYFCIALLFPLLVREKLLGRIFVPAIFLLLSTIPSRADVIFRYLPLFTLGILCFQYFSGMISKRLWYLLTAIATAFALASLNLTAAIAGTLAALAIGISKDMNFEAIKTALVWRTLSWAGAISYSLYLLHVPIGGRVVNIGQRFASNSMESLLTLLLAVVVSMFSAWLLYRLVEKPSQRYSASLKFNAE